MTPLSSKNRNYNAPLIFSGAVSILFGIGLIAVMRHHEMWRDELQGWLLARDCSTFTGFLKQMEYEGTPPLWHVCLWFLKYIYRSPITMQSFNIFIGASFVFIFCYLAPFTKVQKILMPLNYYVFFQYGVVARQYLLGVLCASLACFFYGARAAKPLRLFLALILSSLCSVHTLFLAAGIAFGWAYDLFIAQKTTQAMDDRAMKENKLLLFLFFLSLAFIICWLIPPKDGIFPSTYIWYFHFNLQRLLNLLSVYTTTFLMVPVPTQYFWNSSWLNSLPAFPVWGALIGIIIFGICINFIFDNRTAFIAFTVSTLALMTFFYTKVFGSTRHHGFLFFSFLFASWLARINLKTANRSASILFIENYFLTFLLLLQITGTIIAVKYDWNLPFSNGKAVAHYLVENKLLANILTTNVDYLGPPIEGYIDQSFYYPQGQRWGTYTKWDTRRVEIFGDDELFKRIKVQMKRLNKNAVLLLNRPWNRQQHDVKFLKSFEGSLVGDENYYLYMVQNN